MIYIYRCPVCKKRFRSNSPNEPCCTGPSENRDDHDMTVMQLESAGVQQIHPAFAAKRSAGAFIVLPDHPDFLHR